MLFRVLPAALLLSCTPSDPSDTEDEQGLCSAYTLEEVSPADGAEGVYVGEGFDRIELRWDPSPALPFVDVIPAGGEAVDGRLYEEDGAWIFLPNEPLPADTEVDVSVRAYEGCEPEIVASFTTGPWEAADAAALAGAAPVVEVDGDSSFGELTLGFLPFAVWVRTASDGELGLAIVPVDEEGGDQESCVPTTAAEGTLEGAELVTAPVTAPLSADYGIRLVEAEIRGLVRADLSGLDHVSIVGQLDVDGFADCALLESLGTSCVPCSDGNGDSCVDLDVSGASATAATFTPAVRTEAEVNADGGC